MSGEENKTVSRFHAKRAGRELAMSYIFSCEASGEEPGIEGFERFVPEFREELGLVEKSNRAVNYARKLYEEELLHQTELDAIISRHCHNWSFNRLAAVDRNILRIALTEMLYFPEVPPVVVIDEAVGIARDYSGGDAGSFVNGVLNSVKDTELANRKVTE